MHYIGIETFCLRFAAAWSLIVCEQFYYVFFRTARVLCFFFLIGLVFGWTFPYQAYLHAVVACTSYFVNWCVSVYCVCVTYVIDALTLYRCTIQVYMFMRVCVWHNKLCNMSDCAVHYGVVVYEFNYYQMRRLG